MKNLNKEAFGEGFAAICKKHKANPVQLLKSAGLLDVAERGVAGLGSKVVDPALNAIGTPTARTKAMDFLVNNPVSQAIGNNKASTAGILSALGLGGMAVNKAMDYDPGSIVSQHWPEMAAVGVGLPAAAAMYYNHQKNQAQQQQQPQQKMAEEKKAFLPSPELLAGLGVGLPILGGLGAWQLGNYYKNKDEGNAMQDPDQILNMTPEGQFAFTQQQTQPQQQQQIGQPKKPQVEQSMTL